MREQAILNTSKVTITSTCVVFYAMDKISRANSLLREAAELLNPSNDGSSGNPSSESTSARLVTAAG